MKTKEPSAVIPPNSGSPHQQHLWLALLRTPGVGPIHFSNALVHAGSIENIFSASSEELHSYGFNRSTIGAIHQYSDSDKSCPISEGVNLDLHWLAENNHHLITLHDKAYPVLLSHISDPPPLLFIKGQPEALSTPQIGIVGSRNPSRVGIENAQLFASQLSYAGYCITSGLAFGIDSHAHRGALKNQGATLAVLAHGLNQLYPKQHAALADQIVSTGGALISEFSIGTKPLPGHFPRRNRIISGLSLGILVIEAAIKSGTLITARLAMEQGRDVFALPGSIHNPMSKGCHQLIRDGAILTENLDHITQELPALLSLIEPSTPYPAKKTPPPSSIPQHSNLHSAEHNLLLLIGYDPIGVDALIDSSKLPIHQLQMLLTSLEIKGLIRKEATGHISLVFNSNA